MMSWPSLATALFAATAGLGVAAKRAGQRRPWAAAGFAARHRRGLPSRRNSPVGDVPQRCGRQQRLFEGRLGSPAWGESYARSDADTVAGRCTTRRSTRSRLALRIARECVSRNRPASAPSSKRDVERHGCDESQLAVLQAESSIRPFTTCHCCQLKQRFAVGKLAAPWRC